jgi:hypothetical protein
MELDLRRREKELEAENFETRQKILIHMDRVRSHESEVKREAALNERTMRITAEASQ